MHSLLWWWRLRHKDICVVTSSDCIPSICIILFITHTSVRLGAEGELRKWDDRQLISKNLHSVFAKDSDNAIIRHTVQSKMSKRYSPTCLGRKYHQQLISTWREAQGGIAHENRFELLFPIHQNNCQRRQVMTKAELSDSAGGNFKWWSLLQKLEVPKKKKKWHKMTLTPQFHTWLST